jgi:hypothetical protein
VNVAAPARIGGRHAIASSTPAENKLTIFDSVPVLGTVHAANDNSCAPPIREGEAAVIESDGSKRVIPEHGGIYLIEWVTPPLSPLYGYERRTRAIVQICRSNRGDGWYTHSYVRNRPGKRVLLMSNGPYQDEPHLADNILGRVVGVYRPGPTSGAI